MAIINLFSRRQSAKGKAADVYTYDALPPPLKVQIIHLIREAIGSGEQYDPSKETYLYIHNSLAREFGLFDLSPDTYTIAEKVFNYLLQSKDVLRQLDLVELTFQIVMRGGNAPGVQGYPKFGYDPGVYVDELNERFRQHSVGYQFRSGQIVRVDSEFTHAEVIKPVLVLLSAKKFRGANDEFLSAHEHYRKGKPKEALVDCLKAFESTLKIICDEKRWDYKPGDTAKTLIDICIRNGLIPAYLTSEFASLRGLLESGVPVLRNKSAAHGQGATATVVPDYVAQYALEMTGANILFLVNASQARG